MLTLEDEFDFGKYKGMQVEDVIEDDPSYIEWLMNDEFNRFDDDVIKILERKKII